jgi:hypothetical protein
LIKQEVQKEKEEGRMEKLNNEKLEREIIRQKKIMASIFKNENYISDLSVIGNQIGILDKISSEVCLVVADFKCQSPTCRSEENLQYHHLVTKKAKKYMDTMRYLSARHYWGNIIILCHSCHEKFHLGNGDLKIPNIENSLCIKKETIDKIKKKYTKIEEKDWIINKVEGGK